MQVNLDTMSFRQLLALARTLRGGSFGFDPYRDPRTNRIDSLRGYINEMGKTQADLDAAWELFTTTYSKPARGAGRAQVSNVRANELLGIAEDGASAEPESGAASHGSPSTPAQAPGSLDAIVAQIARQAAQGACNEDRVREIAHEVVADALADMDRPIMAVKINDLAPIEFAGRQHARFPALLQLASARKRSGNRFNIWLHGPAGSGKTTAAINLARSLSLAFHLQQAVIEPFQLLGYRDARGEIIRTPFRDAWEHGGVCLLSEADANSEQAQLAINPGLANDIQSFPDGALPRHADCIIIADANTNGTGGTSQFNGRLKQDAAFMNRFAFFHWPVDESTERAVSGNADWCALVQRARQAASKHGTDISITPRATYDGADLLAQGFDQQTVIALVLRQGATDEAWAPIARECGL